jgi:transposase InsO family protein
VAHRRARLTPFGRWLIVYRVEELGWPVARAAEMSGVSRATAHKWLRRHREDGVGGLEDRSSAPHRRPRALSERHVRRICRARLRAKVGPHRLGPELGLPRSTVYGVLHRRGLSRLDMLDRPTGAPIRRYERERPGELVHLDVKKLGRVPTGGGHRIHGDRRRRGRKIGHDFIHVAVDDRSRWAFVQVHADERGDTTAAFLTAAAAHFAELGIRIERVMTDNAKGYVESRAFQAALVSIGATHKRTRSYRPQTNGKAEAFIWTLQREWAYARPYSSNATRLRALARFVDTYNRRRPHTALGGLPPVSRVQTT